MEARKIIGSAVLAAWALILSAGTAAGQYKSKIDVLKGEKWWGVFVTGEQMMPLEKPFPQTPLLRLQSGQSTIAVSVSCTDTTVPASTSPPSATDWVLTRIVPELLDVSPMTFIIRPALVKAVFACSAVIPITLGTTHFLVGFSSPR